MSISLPRMAAVAVILIAIPLVVVSFRWAMADMYTYPVRYAVERWQSQEEVVTLAALDKATDKIDTALSWSSNNAEYHELKARLLLYRALLVKEKIKDRLKEQPNENSKELSELSELFADFEANIRQALFLHESAIQFRPHWPYSWANKSLMKAHLGEFDQEFLVAIEHAAQYGPWELSANLTVLEAGLMGWRQLKPASRVMVIAAAERAAEHRFKMVRVLLDRYALRYPVCAQMARTSQQQKLCQ